MNSENIDDVIGKHFSFKDFDYTEEEENNSGESFVKRSEEQQQIIDSNSLTGVEPNSYRLIGIVNHLGLSSNSGHYISDVYNIKSKTWISYDDTKVEAISEEQVLKRRAKTGYIFFYIHNSFIA